MSEQLLTSIDGLVRALVRQPSSAYAAILARYAVPDLDLTPFLRWNTRHYTRTCIHRSDDFELLLICYGPGQSTSIHDYGSQTAWVHPVLGEVVEERFALGGDGTLRLASEQHLRPGMDDRWMDGHAIHRFTNRGPERAVTLNLYAKPLRQWRVYHELTGTPAVTKPGPR